MLDLTAAAASLGFAVGFRHVQEISHFAVPGVLARTPRARLLLAGVCTHHRLVIWAGDPPAAGDGFVGDFVGGLRPDKGSWLFASAGEPDTDVVFGARDGAVDEYLLRRVDGQRPTTSRTLSMNSGSMESLNVCERCGVRANSRQIHETADCDIPVAAAVGLVDRWVAFSGLGNSPTPRDRHHRGDTRRMPGRRLSRRDLLHPHCPAPGSITSSSGPASSASTGDSNPDTAAAPAPESRPNALCTSTPATGFPSDTVTWLPYGDLHHNASSARLAPNHAQGPGP